MQNLFYNTASSSLTLSDPDKLDIIWNNVSSLVPSSSLLQILAFSGSTVLANFPINNTNIIYSPFMDITSSVSTSSYNILIWKFLDVYSTTGSYSIFDSSSLTYYVSESGNGQSTNGGLTLINGHNHILKTTSSGSYTSYLTLKDVTSGSIVTNISASNSPVSTSFNPVQFHNYEVTFSVEGTAP